MWWCVQHPENHSSSVERKRIALFIMLQIFHENFPVDCEKVDPKNSLHGIWSVAPLIYICLTEDNISSPASFIPILTELPHHAYNIKYPPFQVTKEPTPQHREFVKPVTMVNQCRHSPPISVDANFSVSTFNVTTNLYNKICPCHLKEVLPSNITIRESLERSWWFQKNLKEELDPEYSPDVKKYWGEKNGLQVHFVEDDNRKEAKEYKSMSLHRLVLELVRKLHKKNP
ncbi:hypothetical protein llap_3364 [Limosa lapponica baueri]|uniref:Uncharacterized protein n=1 Tax=Limosa lapponica baueri TaxID=1758121 RepID=A0A2I0UJX0_LIMLA|nr:hypothetical protein llap_3364 [Limosa lapponica baueri]